MRRHPFRLARRATGVGPRVLLGLLLVATRVAAEPTATPAEAGLLSVVASVDRAEATIGDPIRYTVQITAPVGARVVVPVYSGTIGELTITDFGDAPPREENGRTTITRWYTLTGFTPGEHSLPAPKVAYFLSEEELQADGNEVKLTIVSLLEREPSANDIRDIKPVEEPPFDWQPIGYGAAALAGLLLLGGAFYYLLNRPKRAYVVPPPPPHEVALAALSKLRGRRYIEEGRFETFYIELSAIARRYLEDRFHLRAPEMTTEEFLATAGRDQRLSIPQRRLLGDFLSQADLVKFARHHPTLQDTEAAFDAAQRFVEETRPGPTGAQEAGRAAA